MGVVVAVMMIAINDGDSTVDRQEEGRSYKTVLLAVMVITHFNFPAVMIDQSLEQM